MMYVLAVLGGILAGIPLSGFLFGRWVDEERFRRYLRRIAARREWPWLLDVATAQEALARERLARKQVGMLGACLESVKALSYHDRLCFGPARLGTSEQYIRIDFAEDGGLLFPVAVVSGRGPWITIPLEKATPERVLEAMGPPDTVPLARLLARTPDEQLLQLPGAQRSALIHALARDEELPGIVEGLVDRHQRRKAS